MTERVANSQFVRLIGGLIAVGGLWHALAPWFFGYAHLNGAAVSNVVSGLALALAGGALALGARGWPIAACAVIGLWVLAAPQALQFQDHGLAANESLWGGLFVLVLSGIAALAWKFRGPLPVAPAPR